MIIFFFEKGYLVHLVMHDVFDPSGSGVPEARAILLGIDMPDYLSLSNLFAKLFGLICTLASGSTVFLGKVVRNHRICK